MNARKAMLDVTEQDWDATFALNLDAPFFLAQYLAPAMIERRWGRIINIASLQIGARFRRFRCLRRHPRVPSRS